MLNSELSAEIDRVNTIRELRMIADDLEKGCSGFNWLIGFDFTGGYRVDFKSEINRLKVEFAGADENKIRALDALIEQAAYEKLYLRRLNEQAIVTGLVKYHPDNPAIQQTLPVSGEIAKHSAALTNIMDKLMKHLAVPIEEEDEGLGEYE